MNQNWVKFTIRVIFQGFALVSLCFLLFHMQNNAWRLSQLNLVFWRYPVVYNPRLSLNLSSCASVWEFIAISKSTQCFALCPVLFLFFALVLTWRNPRGIWHFLVVYLALWQIHWRWENRQSNIPLDEVTFVKGKTAIISLRFINFLWFVRKARHSSYLVWTATNLL